MSFIFNILMGVIAGIGSRYVEKPLGAMISDKIDLPEADLRVLAFIVALVAVSFLMVLGSVNGMPLVLLIGGALGIFGSHVLKFGREQKAAMMKKMEERTASAGNSTDEVEPKAAAKKPAAKKPAAKKKTDS